MKNFRVKSSCIGDCSSCNQYEGIAFDGCYFYLSEPCHCKIYKCNEKMELVTCMEVCRAYTQLCYDTKEKCFWACTTDCNYKIYKLDHHFKEIDYIQVPYAFHRYGNIVSISYDASLDRLFLGITNAVLELDKYDMKKSVLKVEIFAAVVLSVVAFCGHFLVTYLVDCMQKSSLYDKNAKEIREIEVNNEYILVEGTQVASNPMVQLCFLAMKHNCYPYMILCDIPNISCRPFPPVFKPEHECHPFPPICKPEHECHPFPPVCKPEHECHPFPPVCKPEHEAHPCPPVCKPEHECHPFPPVCKPEHECHPCPPICKPEHECHPCPPVCKPEHECHPFPPVCKPEHECHPCPPICKPEHECHPCPPVCKPEHEAHPCPPVCRPEHECHPNCSCKGKNQCEDAYEHLRNQKCNVIDCCNHCGRKKELCECLEHLCLDDYCEYDISL